MLGNERVYERLYFYVFFARRSLAVVRSRLRIQVESVQRGSVRNRNRVFGLAGKPVLPVPTAAVAGRRSGRARYGNGKVYFSRCGFPRSLDSEEKA